VVFKALKWVLHITHRIFNRYSEPQICSAGTDKAFAELFVVRASLRGIGAGGKGKHGI
jgi:hypothetical protein